MLGSLRYCTLLSNVTTSMKLQIYRHLFDLTVARIRLKNDGNMNSCSLVLREALAVRRIKVTTRLQFISVQREENANSSSQPPSKILLTTNTIFYLRRNGQSTTCGVSYQHLVRCTTCKMNCNLGGKGLPFVEWFKTISASRTPSA